MGRLSSRPVSSTGSLLLSFAQPLAKFSFRKGEFLQTQGASRAWRVRTGGDSCRALVSSRARVFSARVARLFPCSALRCATLRYAALRCATLRHAAPRRAELRYAALRYVR